MSTYYAVLFDVVSIQKYVFSSNELVDNLGASHIVKNLLMHWLFRFLPMYSALLKKR